MDKYAPLKAKIDFACLIAARSLGPDIKKLSWFARNAKRLPVIREARPQPLRESITKTTAKAA